MLLKHLVEQPPTYTPITLKAINININKYSSTDLMHIYALKFKAILKWLEVFEVFDFGNEINFIVNDVKNLQALIECLQKIKHGLSNRCSIIKYRQ